VNERWISYLSKIIEKQTGIGPRFRSTGSLGFQALRTFCNLADQTINHSLTQFYSDQYISASVTPQRSFEAEIGSSIDKFQSSSKSSFSLSLAMIRNTTQANALFSALETNCELYLTYDRTKFGMRHKEYKDCNCAFSSKCTEQFYNVPGFYAGCFVVESLFQSTLECFYDQQCIDNLIRSLLPSPSMNVTALDASSSSNYPKNSTIKKLVDNLMIEQWNTTTVFENYYNACQPKQCTYTFETHNDIIYILTTLFGIAGGLTQTLKLVIPRFVNIILYCIRKQRTRIIPEMSTVEM
jgi:hypothetical protein